jgi:hypothetical protein
MADVTVEQGMFRVSDVSRVAGGEEEGFLVLYADCDSKYPCTIDSSGTEGIPEVLVFPQVNEDGSYRSLHLDGSKRDKPTQITLPAYTEGWSMISDGGRYTVRIVAWRPDAPDGWEELWREGNTRGP